MRFVMRERFSGKSSQLLIFAFYPHPEILNMKLVMYKNYVFPRFRNGVSHSVLFPLFFLLPNSPNLSAPLFWVYAVSPGPLNQCFQAHP